MSLPTCKSACENFFISCNYEEDLWRCGKSKYFNGYDVEQPCTSEIGCAPPEDVSGAQGAGGDGAAASGDDADSGSDDNEYAIYLRDYFPGQPFRKNKYSPDGDVRIDITPKP
jgi:hypothetical protein